MHIFVELCLYFKHCKVFIVWIGIKCLITFPILKLVFLLILSSSQLINITKWNKVEKKLKYKTDHTETYAKTYSIFARR